MFSAEGVWTIQDSIFSKNVIDDFVGECNGYPGELKCARCSFDNSSRAEAIGGIERSAIN
jgi:hypothetical protein